jgi:transposase-like protein
MDKQQKQIVKNRVVAKWRALFELQKSSSTTITEFCKLHNVNRASFYQWKELLRKREQQDNKEFIPIKLSAMPTEANRISSKVRINFANGVNIEFQDGCKLGELKLVIETLCC